MSFQPDRPYNDPPDLPPDQETETRTILKACIEARAALAEVRVAGGLIPNQAVLINSIPILEAQASSEIENIVTTTDRLFQFAGRPDNQADPATKEALRYRVALHQGFEMLRERPLSTNMAAHICRTITGVEMDIRATPGTALVNDANGEIVQGNSRQSSDTARFSPLLCATAAAIGYWLEQSLIDLPEPLECRQSQRRGGIHAPQETYSSGGSLRCRHLRLHGSIARSCVCAATTTGRCRKAAGAAGCRI